MSRERNHQPCGHCTAFRLEDETTGGGSCCAEPPKPILVPVKIGSQFMPGGQQAGVGIQSVWSPVNIVQLGCRDGFELDPTGVEMTKRWVTTHPPLANTDVRQIAPQFRPGNGGEKKAHND